MRQIENPVYTKEAYNQKVKIFNDLSLTPTSVAEMFVCILKDLSKDPENRPSARRNLLYLQIKLAPRLLVHLSSNQLMKLKREFGSSVNFMVEVECINHILYHRSKLFRGED